MPGSDPSTESGLLVLRPDSAAPFKAPETLVTSTKFIATGSASPPTIEAWPEDKFTRSLDGLSARTGAIPAAVGPPNAAISAVERRVSQNARLLIRPGAASPSSSPNRCRIAPMPWRPSTTSPVLVVPTSVPSIYLFKLDVPELWLSVIAMRCQVFGITTPW